MGLTSEKIAEMRESRREALVAKWATGARMATDELTEIADIISPEKSAAKKEPGADLVLESVAPDEPESASGCRHALIDGSPYEAEYGATMRTIKRWRQVGAKAKPPEFPPLDHPWRMAAWFRAHMTRRVPKRLEDLEAKGPPQVAPPLAAANTPIVSTQTPAAVSAPAAGSARVAEPLATGYGATLARFEQAEALAARRYFAAFESEDSDVRATASRLKSEWEDVAQTYRAYARDGAKIMKDIGAAWDAEEVKRILTDMHNVIAPGIRRLWRRMWQRYPDLGAQPMSVQQERWEKEVDTLFGCLANNAFTSATLPDPEPAPEPAGLAA